MEPSMKSLKWLDIAVLLNVLVIMLVGLVSEKVYIKVFAAIVVFLGVLYFINGIMFNNLLKTLRESAGQQNSQRVKRFYLAQKAIIILGVALLGVAAVLILFKVKI